MSQTLTSLLVHIVFSTKDRQPLITPDVAPRLYTYMRGIASEQRSPALAINGADDHIHLLISLAKTVTVADLVMHIKKGSSRWIKEQGDTFRTFAWQEGYGAFSVGQSQVPAVERYIADQRERHRRTDFKSEFLALLRKYNVEYDERYIWS